ncbi:hypothetical protein C8R44DRAFT_895574 [Mycena epipterygia]|nr:hypothetical protein C8R44DRAFT_895574 [Mycena epipterygia]
MSARVDYLHLLPTEVWLVCWTLCSTRQLRRVSLHVNLQTLPSGFQFRREDWENLLRRMHRIAVRLDRLAEDPLVLSVRSWKFTAWGCQPPVWHSSGTAKSQLWHDTYWRAITAFSSTLGLYQQLRSLDIEGFTVDKSFRHAFVSLTMLEELNLHRCDIVARDGALVKLKSFTISGYWIGSGMRQDSLKLVSPDRLQTLKIESLAIISLGRRPAHFLAGYNIGPDMIPLLRSLNAPLAVVRLLAPNRPVRAMRVSWDQTETLELLPALLDISRASVPLRSLVVHQAMTPESFTAILSLFSELQDLSIRILEENIDFEFLCCLMRRPTVDRADPPSVELSDEHAFDDLPADDISDGEEEKTARVITLVDDSIHPELPAPSNLYKLLNGICRGVISLPPEINVLALQVDIEIPRLSTAHEHQVVVSLSRLYPLLREVRLGYRGNIHWEREGALWKRCGGDDSQYIHPSPPGSGGDTDDGCGRNFEAKIPKIVPNANGFVATLLDAYTQDRALVIRPDDVWLAILSQFNFFVNARADLLRASFVSDAGKKELVIDARPQSLRTIDLAHIAREMAGLVGKNVVDTSLRAWTNPDFTTTTINDTTVSAVLLMATLKHYFEERSDWAKILSRLEKLKEYGLETIAWYHLLRPVIARFIAAFDKPTSPYNVDFWQRVAISHNGSDAEPVFESIS